jgi:hypothetical protein
MTVRNRNLIRKPWVLLRVHEEERADIERLIDECYSGGEPGAVVRQALLDMAKAKRMERNSLAPNRLDNSVFSSLRAA